MFLKIGDFLISNVRFGPGGLLGQIEDTRFFLESSILPMFVPALNLTSFRTRESFLTRVIALSRTRFLVSLNTFSKDALPVRWICPSSRLEGKTKSSGTKLRHQLDVPENWTLRSSMDAV
jgi:hypothetical protein